MKLNKNNQSGYPGIYLETKTKKYRAAFNLCGTKIQLGHFPTLDAAVNARSEAESILTNEGLIPFVAKLSNLTQDVVQQNVDLAFTKYEFSKDMSFPVFLLKFMRSGQFKIEAKNTRKINPEKLLNDNQLFIYKNFTKNGLSLRQISDKINSSVFLVKNELKSIQTMIIEENCLK